MSQFIYDCVSRLVAWGDELVRQNRPKGRPLLEFGFPRLEQYATQEWLASINIILCDELPTPPLEELAHFGAEAINDAPWVMRSYGRLVYIRKDVADQEEIFFLAMIYEALIERVGVKKMATAYLFSVAFEGTMKNPIDELGTAILERYRTDTHPFDLRETIREEVGNALTMIESQQEIVKQLLRKPGLLDGTELGPAVT